VKSSFPSSLPGMATSLALHRRWAGSRQKRMGSGPCRSSAKSPPTGPPIRRALSSFRPHRRRADPLGAIGTPQVVDREEQILRTGLPHHLDAALARVFQHVHFAACVHVDNVERRIRRGRHACHRKPASTAPQAGRVNACHSGEVCPAANASGSSVRSHPRFRSAP
jgi:hypothetical protein